MALGEWEVAVAKDFLIFRHHRPLLRDRVLEIDPEAVIDFFIEPDQLVGPNALVVEFDEQDLLSTLRLQTIRYIARSITLRC